MKFQGFVDRLLVLSWWENPSLVWCLAQSRRFIKPVAWTRECRGKSVEEGHPWFRDEGSGESGRGGPGPTQSSRWQRLRQHQREAPAWLLLARRTNPKVLAEGEQPARAQIHQQPAHLGTDPRSSPLGHRPTSSLLGHRPTSSQPTLAQTHQQPTQA